MTDKKVISLHSPCITGKEYNYIEESLTSEMLTIGKYCEFTPPDRLYARTTHIPGTKRARRSLRRTLFSVDIQRSWFAFYDHRR